MAAQRSGVILNTCSVAGHTGGGGTLPYAAAKAGVITFTRGLARELAPLGIRVNGVSPGVIDTPMQHLAPPGELFRLAAQIPLKRVGVPEEVVGAFLFLASPQAAYITGEIIEVNGGLLMH
jgi:3-oxoacyl-[acyl-carrier protein] reductase